MSKSGQTRPTIGRFQDYNGGFRATCWSMLAELGPISVDSEATLVKTRPHWLTTVRQTMARLRPTSIKICPASSKLGTESTELARNRPNLARNGTASARDRLTSVKLSPDMAKVAPSSAKLGPVWAKFGPSGETERLSIPPSTETPQSWHPHAHPSRSRGRARPHRRWQRGWFAV